MTLMRTSARTLLVRIAHLFEDSEGSASGGIPAITEDIGALLAQFHCPGKPEELTLSGNQLRGEAEERRLKFTPGESMAVNDGWKEKEREVLARPKRGGLGGSGNDDAKGGWLVHLEPMEVRTYEIEC